METIEELRTENALLKEQLSSLQLRLLMIQAVINGNFTFEPTPKGE